MREQGSILITFIIVAVIAFAAYLGFQQILESREAEQAREQAEQLIENGQKANEAFEQAPWNN